MNAVFMQCVFLLIYMFPFNVPHYKNRVNVQQADELVDCGLPSAHNRFSSLELISTAFILETSLERAEAD